MAESDEAKFRRLTAPKAELERKVVELEQRNRVARGELRRQLEIARCIDLMANPIRLPSC